MNWIDSLWWWCSSMNTWSSYQLLGQCFLFPFSRWNNELISASWRCSRNKQKQESQHITAVAAGNGHDDGVDGGNGDGDGDGEEKNRKTVNTHLPSNQIAVPIFSQLCEMDAIFFKFSWWSMLVFFSFLLFTIQIVCVCSSAFFVVCLVPLFVCCSWNKFF